MGKRATLAFFSSHFLVSYPITEGKLRQCGVKCVQKRFMKSQENRIIFALGRGNKFLEYLSSFLLGSFAENTRNPNPSSDAGGLQAVVRRPQDVVQQGRLPGTQKARDDGHRDLLNSRWRPRRMLRRYGSNPLGGKLRCSRSLHRCSQQIEH